MSKNYAPKSDPKLFSNDDAAQAYPFLTYYVRDDEKLRADIMDEVRMAGAAQHLAAGRYFSAPAQDSFYYVEQGRLRMEYTGLNGFERNLLVYAEGSMFHLASAIHQCWVNAILLPLCDCLVWRIPASVLMDGKNSCRFPHLTRAALRVLSSIMLTYYGALTFLEGSSFKTRFCRYIALLMHRHDSRIFPLEITQDQCAATLGAHRATLARVVRELKNEGILECFTKDRVHILDAEKLMEIARLR